MIQPHFDERQKSKFSIFHFQFSILPQRPGFSALELLLAIGIIGALSAVSIPVYRDYLIRNDLSVATDQISQAIARAKILSQAGQHETRWGFSVSHNTLFAGQSYAQRNPLYDELYPIPETIATSGLDELSFARLTGVPSATGTILLTSLRGEQREVEILIDREGIPVNLSDRITLCHCEGDTPKTLYLPESAWPAHSDHGDYLGPCRLPDPEVYCRGD